MHNRSLTGSYVLTARGVCGFLCLLNNDNDNNVDCCTACWFAFAVVNAIPLGGGANAGALATSNKTNRILFLLFIIMESEDVFCSHLSKFVPWVEIAVKRMKRSDRWQHTPL